MYIPSIVVVHDNIVNVCRLNVEACNMHPATTYINNNKTKNMQSSSTLMKVGKSIFGINIFIFLLVRFGFKDVVGLKFDGFSFVS